VRYICFASVERFYVSELGQAGGCFVHREKRVLDADRACEARGVSAGMPLSEARAVLSGEIAGTEWSAERFLAAQERWLDVCAEFSDSVESADQHEAFLDLSFHPDALEIRERLRAEIERQTGLSVRLGLAGCRWLAREAALRGDEEALALRRPAEYAAELPVSALPVPVEHAQRLRFLGYSSVGEAAHLRLETLCAQFGQGAFAIRSGVRGTGPAEVRGDYPPDSMSGRISFDGAPETREQLHAGLLELAKQVGTRLAESDRIGEEMALSLEHEDGTVSVLKRKFAKPIGSPGSLWASIQLLCAEDAPRPVVGARVRLSRLRHGRRVQLELDGRRWKREGATGAIEHVRAAFGQGSIQLASEMAEPRWASVRRAWRAANGWTWV